ncbi:MAG: hypothetical protein LC808_26455, partial [Actinobacteria bacterium]|nr:hypothetical protein [Actinomycetota bacterium]
ADDFVVLVRGTRAHAEAMVTEIGAVLEEMALALSSEKTSITVRHGGPIDGVQERRSSDATGVVVTDTGIVYRSIR